MHTQQAKAASVAKNDKEPSAREASKVFMVSLLFGFRIKVALLYVTNGVVLTGPDKRTVKI